MSKTTFLQVFATKEMRRGATRWTVRRQRRTGSIVWTKHFKTQAEAKKYAAACRAKER